MRVLVVTNHFWPENFRINDLAFWLRGRGHEVTVFTGIPNYPEGKFYSGYGLFKKRIEDHQGISIRRFPLIPRGKGGAWDLVLNYISAALLSCLTAPFCCPEKYDLIFVFETSPVTIGLPAIWLKRLRGIPILFWVLDIWPESLSATGAVKNPLLLGLIRKMVRFIYRRCDKILVTSRGFVESIRSTGGYFGRIGYFPNWVEPEYLTAPEREEPTDLPALPAGFRVMYAGNIGAAQDFETVLAAAESLGPLVGIHWIILGDGRRTGWVEAEIKRRGLNRYVHLLGRYPASLMPYFFQQADALLLTLRNEPIFSLTVPGKLQSYLAAGKPILAGLNGEGAQIVESSGAGLTCPAENPVALAARVKDLFLMPVEERKKMGENGKRFCRAHFDRETLFLKFETLMVSLPGKNPGQSVSMGESFETF